MVHAGSAANYPFLAFWLFYRFAAQHLIARQKANIDLINSELANQRNTLFTPTERRIAELLTEGLHQYEIAHKLYLTSSEVGEYIKSIREKVIIPGSGDPHISAVVGKYKLTRRETDVLRCLLRNMGNTEIAAELFVSEETVKTHVHSLLKKMKVENRKKIIELMESLSKG